MQLTVSSASGSSSEMIRSREYRTAVLSCLVGLVAGGCGAGGGGGQDDSDCASFDAGAMSSNGVCVGGDPTGAEQADETA